MAMKALRLCTQNPKAEFRSQFQRRWVEALFHKDDDMLVIARTGGGKSMAYMLPGFVEDTGCTIVIQPLNALVRETGQLLAEKGVHHAIYNGVRKRGAFALCRVIVVSVDKAMTEGFGELLRTLRINRFVIDEAHCYRDDNTYRNYACVIRIFRTYHVPFVFTTASMPPSHTIDLATLFTTRSLTEYREDTVRPELELRVLDSQFSQATKAVLAFRTAYTQEMRHPTDRAIVFIQSIKICHEFALELENLKIPVVIYHGGLVETLAEDAVALWKQTEHCVMVSTSAFGAGVHYPQVRLVTIVGLPKLHEVNRAYQEMGRAGRDGNRALVLFAAYRTPVDPLELQLFNKQKCIMGTFSYIEDGRIIECKDARGHLCSACQLQAAAAAMVAAEEAEAEAQAEAEAHQALAAYPDWAPFSGDEDPLTPGDAHSAITGAPINDTLSRKWDESDAPSTPLIDKRRKVSLAGTAVSTSTFMSPTSPSPSSSDPSSSQLSLSRFMAMARPKGSKPVGLIPFRPPGLHTQKHAQTPTTPVSLHPSASIPASSASTSKVKMVPGFGAMKTEGTDSLAATARKAHSGAATFIGNSIKANKDIALEAQMTIAIERVRKSHEGMCPWCWAEDSELIPRHPGNSWIHHCPQAKKLNHASQYPPGVTPSGPSYRCLRCLSCQSHLSLRVFPSSSPSPQPTLTVSPVFLFPFQRPTKKPASAYTQNTVRLLKPAQTLHQALQETCVSFAG